MPKFGKNREVDSQWLHTPVMYLSSVNSSDTMSNGKYVVTDEVIHKEYDNYIEFSKRLGEDESELDTFDEYKEQYKRMVEEGYTQGEWIEPKHDKTFCIVDLYKTHAICGWRNNTTCKMGRTFTCNIEKHNGRPCLKYKDKYYQLDTKFGWVF